MGTQCRHSIFLSILHSLKRHKTKLKHTFKYSAYAGLLGLFSNQLYAQDFQNFSCNPGQQLSSLPGENNRTMFIDYVDGHVITSRHGQGVLKAWDLSNPFNPRLAREYNNGGWTSSHVHSYLPGEILVMGWGGWTHLDVSNALNINQVSDRFNRRGSSMTFFPIGFDDVPAAYGYNRNQRDIEIVDLKTGESLSRIPVMDQTGFIGRPNLVGNILIVTGDNEMPEGVATYDVSDLRNPILLDTIRTTSSGGRLNKAYDSTPIWGNYVVLANNRDTGNSLRAVDLIDYSDPRNLRHERRVLENHSRTRYAQFQDEFMFVGDAKVDLSDRNFPIVETFPGGDGEYNLPIGNLLVTSGMNRGNTLRVWCHQAEPDRRAPMVAYHIPRPNEVNVARTGRVGLLIPETLELGSVNNNNIFIRPMGGNPIAADISWNDHDVMNVTPHNMLAANTTYEVVVRANGIRDVAGNAMAQDFTFRFSTGNSIDGTPTPTPTPTPTSQPTSTPTPNPTATPTPTPTATPNPPGEGECPIKVRARGDTGEEQIELIADGLTRASWQVSTQYQEFTANISDGTTVEVAFINDGSSSNGEDKNVRINYIDVDGSIMQAEDSGDNTGVYANGSCGGGDFSEWLHCNGRIGFGVVECSDDEPSDTPPEIDEVTVSDARAQINTEINFNVFAQDNETAQLQYAFDFGDGNTRGFSINNNAQHSFDSPGLYTIRARVRDGDNNEDSQSINVLIYNPIVAHSNYSSPLATDTASDRIWNVNPDNNTVTSIRKSDLSKLFEVTVSQDPRNIVLAGDDTLWVSSHDDGVIDILNSGDGSQIAQIPVDMGGQLHGLVASPDGSTIYVAAMADGRIYRLDVASRSVTGQINVGPWSRALAISHDGNTLLATRFISPTNRAEIYRIDTTQFDSYTTISLAFDNTSEDSDRSARGVLNYLTSVVIAPDAKTAWVTSKKDNTAAGLARDGSRLTFETSVRATVSKIDLEANQELREERIDIDNQELPTGIAFSRNGGFAYVSMQGNNQVVTLNALSGEVYDRTDVGFAPQGIIVDFDSDQIFTHNFLSRSVSSLRMFDEDTQMFDEVVVENETTTVSQESLSDSVLEGKRIFYNAADTRMSRDGYLSCASCHLDGGHDGRVWDFTQRGEGLRNTTDLRGRRGMGHGRVHWTGNFDEIQDFEHDIRGEFGGTGFMSDADFNSDNRNTPLGGTKAGASEELDALAAYVGSLSEFGTSPYRRANGTLNTRAERGRQLFQSLDCATCHSGSDFTDSNDNPLHNVGTLKASSGQRLGDTLTGIDTPTLRGLWNGAPFFHDGSAANLRQVINQSGHGDAQGLSDDEQTDLIHFLMSIDDHEPAIVPTPQPTPEPTPDDSLVLSALDAELSSGVSYVSGWGAGDVGANEWVRFSGDQLEGFNRVRVSAAVAASRTFELRRGSPTGAILAVVEFTGSNWSVFENSAAVSINTRDLNGQDIYFLVAQNAAGNLTANLKHLEFSHVNVPETLDTHGLTGEASPGVSLINGWGVGDIGRDEWLRLSNKDLRQFNRVHVYAAANATRMVELRDASPSGPVLAEIPFTGNDWSNFSASETVHFNNLALSGNDVYLTIRQSQNGNRTLNVERLVLSYQSHVEPHYIDATSGTPSNGVTLYNNWGAADIGPGEWIEFEANHLTQYSSIKVSAQSVGSRTIEIRANSPSGPLVAEVPFNGNSWSNFIDSSEVSFNYPPSGNGLLYLRVQQHTINLESLTLN